jgi:hypothetical protein
MPIYTDQESVEDILHRAEVCHIGCAVDAAPYVVPVSFGYAENVIYFHTKKRGKLQRMLRRNNYVCFQLDVDQRMVRAERACRWTVRYRSVIGFGHAHSIEGHTEKRNALDVIMAQYSDQTFDYDEAALEKAAVMRIEIEHVTARVEGYPAPQPGGEA